MEEVKIQFFSNYFVDILVCYSYRESWSITKLQASTKLNKIQYLRYALPTQTMLL